MAEDQKKKFDVHYLWRWNGEIGRISYFITGTVLFALKYNIDRAIAYFGFGGRSWSITNYLWPGQGLQSLIDKPDDRKFFLTMILCSLPFIWFGLALTLRRLRDANLPSWLVKLFFFPFVNLALFLWLCVAPTNRPEETLALTQHDLDERTRRMDADASNSPDVFINAALLPIPFAFATIVLGVSAFSTYGWGVFVGTPFAVGMASALLYARNQRRTWGQCQLVAMTAILILGVGLFLFAFEGVICLAMAAPIAAIIACIGATFGWVAQAHQPSLGNSTVKTWLPILALFTVAPTIMGAEYLAPPEPPLFSVSTAIKIHAPAEKVWKNVVSFAQLPPPTNTLFRLGVSCPMYARIDGKGVGAVRHCVFTTGEFVEPITVWKEPSLLRFGVTAQPAAMRELSINPDLNPPHLRNYLVSKQGQFLLTKINDNETLLVGTTWYQHHMYPAQYWRLWSDWILHQIHERVLQHVKNLSEADA